MSDTNTSWTSSLTEKTVDATAGFLEIIPDVIGAVIILIVGFFIARLVRNIVRRLTNTINRILDRIFQTGTLSGIRLTGTLTSVLAEITFWVILFLTITMAARMAGFSAISGWLNEIVFLLPNLVLGSFIIAFGYGASLYAAKLVAESGDKDASSQRLLTSRLVQAFVFITALIIGLDQIGVKVSFLITLLTVVIGAAIAGFSIAFGLGAQGFVRNLIGARTARSSLQKGLKVKIGDIEGEVLEITTSHLALDTTEGRTLIPASFVDTQKIEILTTEKGK